MKPGEILCRNAFITLNEGLETRTISARNAGDRPIQVGSHFHFFEVNRFMIFDREQTYGFRPDIVSGSAIRFEPGETKEVQLVRIAGKSAVYGFNNLTNAQINDTTLAHSLREAETRGFTSSGEKQ